MPSFDVPNFTPGKKTKGPSPARRPPCLRRPPPLFLPTAKSFLKEPLAAATLSDQRPPSTAVILSEMSDPYRWSGKKAGVTAAQEIKAFKSILVACGFSGSSSGKNTRLSREPLSLHASAQYPARWSRLVRWRQCENNALLCTHVDGALLNI